MGARSEFRFVHAADLHLGGRRWLHSEPRDPWLRALVRDADRVAQERLIELCIEVEASLLLCAGDVFDRNCRDHFVALRFAESLTRLDVTGTHSVLLLGNHDEESRQLAPLLLPRRARVLGMGGAESLAFHELGAVVHGVSLPEVAAGSCVVSQHPPPWPGWFNIGLLHTSAEGVSGHPRYAPCSRRNLRRHGYDYWALGHVHSRQVLSEAPWAIFPGNLQGRGPRERGLKGATVVHVANHRVVSVEHRAVAPLVFDSVRVDTDETETFDELMGRSRRALFTYRERLATPTIAALVLAGPDGMAAALRTPESRRSAALARLVDEVSDHRLWLDQVSFEVDDGVAWPELRAA